jgi:hypothetical protein
MCWGLGEVWLKIASLVRQGGEGGVLRKEFVMRENRNATPCWEQCLKGSRGHLKVAGVRSRGEENPCPAPWLELLGPISSSLVGHPSSQRAPSWVGLERFRSLCGVRWQARWPVTPEPIAPPMPPELLVRAHQVIAAEANGGFGSGRAYRDREVETGTRGSAQSCSGGFHHEQRVGPVGITGSLMKAENGRGEMDGTC